MNSSKANNLIEMNTMLESYVIIFHMHGWGTPSGAMDKFFVIDVRDRSTHAFENKTNNSMDGEATSWPKLLSII